MNVFRAGGKDTMKNIIVFLLVIREGKIRRRNSCLTLIATSQPGWKEIKSFTTNEAFLTSRLESETLPHGTHGPKITQEYPANSPALLFGLASALPGAHPEFTSPTVVLIICIHTYALYRLWYIITCHNMSHAMHVDSTCRQ